MLRAIGEIQPRWVVGENVRGLTNWNGGLVFDEVQADLEAAGYEVLPFLLPAAGVNAPHRRDRIWFIAHRTDARVEGVRPGGQNTIHAALSASNASGAGCEKFYAPDLAARSGHGSRLSTSPWADFPTQSPVCERNDGVFADTHFRTFQNENAMDRSLVIKSALDTGRLIVDFETGKVYSTRQRGKEGCPLELPGAECNGYIVHNISYDGIKKQCRAHQIIWIAAHGLYDKETLMIDHINRNKKDNRLVNLRLVDAKGNRENATPYEGKLTKEQKDMVWFMNKESNMTMKEISEIVGISKSRVQQIVSDHEGLDGITFSKWRNESIKALGNAIVPQVAHQLFKAIEAYEQTTPL